MMATSMLLAFSIAVCFSEARLQRSSMRGAKILSGGEAPALGSSSNNPLFEQCRARRSKSLSKRTFVVDESGNETGSKGSSSLVQLSGFADVKREGKKDDSACTPSEVPLMRFTGGKDVSIACCAASSFGCAGCEKLASGDKNKCADDGCAGGFQKDSDGSCVACRDVPGFLDPRAASCATYVEQGICARGALDAQKFRSFVKRVGVPESIAPHLFTQNGISALDACCACGGGMRAATPFSYSASVQPYVIGKQIHDYPRPRTANEYRVAGAVEGAGCALHSHGLKLNAKTGELSGIPTAEEPVQLECQIEGVQAKGGHELISNATLRLDLQWFAYSSKVLSFPSQEKYVPDVAEGHNYSDWKVGCTPDAPWLDIDAADGSLTSRQVGPPPEAAVCTVSVWNGSATHELRVTVAFLKHWDDMQLMLQIGPKHIPEPASVVDLVVGRVVPGLRLGAKGDAGGTPPAFFYAHCSGDGVSTMFDRTTGDIVVNGHVAFRLNVATGELSGIPDAGVLGECAATARCQISLTCSFFGELTLQPGGQLPKLLYTSTTVKIRDDTCWQLLPAGEARWRRVEELTERPGKTCRDKCRRLARCAAYHAEGSKCFSVRRISEDAACPARCRTCGGSAGCNGYCTSTGTCEASPRAGDSGSWKTLYSQGTYCGESLAEAKFNAEVQSSSGIVKRLCSGCQDSHKEIYYRRKKGLSKWNAYQHLLVTWKDDGFHTDFDLYSTLDDALADRNAWRFCNGDDTGIAFPRNCGPTKSVSGNWHSLTREGQRNYQFSVLGRPAGYADCRACGGGQDTWIDAAHVRVNDCEAQGTCLALNIRGGLAFFLQGEYCPASDGRTDGALPFYAKEGEVPEATLYLAPWDKARELESTTCSPSTTWVVRRASPAEDYFEGAHADLRGPVLACVQGADLAPTKQDPSWGLGDAVMDELRSDVRLGILYRRYVDANSPQDWKAHGSVKISGREFTANGNVDRRNPPYASTVGKLRQMVFRPGQNNKRIRIGLTQKKTSSRDGLSEQGYELEFANKHIFFHKKGKKDGSNTTYESGDEFALKLDSKWLLLYQGSALIHSWSLGGNLDSMYGYVIFEDAATLEMMNVYADALVAPVARTCVSPLLARRDAKKKAKERAADGEGAFVFHDPDAVKTLKQSYSLHACECFSEAFGPNAPVSEETYAKLPPGSGNSFVPGSQLIVAGSFSCQPAALMVTLVGVGQAGCELACRSGEYNTCDKKCAFYFTGQYTEQEVCRLYSDCDELAREVGTQGELYGVGTEDVCLIADPEACWNSVKREKYLASGTDPVGTCMFEGLVRQCDEALIHGGHGVEECGRCEYMRDSASIVALSKMKMPMPSEFSSGAVLNVGCADRYRGLDRFGSNTLPTREVVCVDGIWVDRATNLPGLDSLQCAACVRATKPDSELGGLRLFVAANKQESWWLQRIPIEIHSWKGLCLSTESVALSLPTIDFTDPRNKAAARGHVDYGQSFGAKSWASGFRYGWSGDSTGCSFESQVAIGGSLGGQWTLGKNGFREHALQGLGPGVTYTLTFKARATKVPGQGLQRMGATSWCGTDGCTVSSSCPGGTTLVGCEVASSLGTNSPGRGAMISQGRCHAKGKSTIGAATSLPGWVHGPRDAWTPWHYCPSGYSAVSASIHAASHYQAGGDWWGPWRGNGGSIRAAQVCPKGSWLKEFHIRSGRYVDRIVGGRCTDGTWLHGHHGGGGSPVTLLNDGRGRQYVDVWGGGLVDRICMAGCGGRHGGSHARTDCGSRGLLAGFQFYSGSRLDRVRFLCRHRRPVVHAFQCIDNRCRALCQNDVCHVKPICLKGNVVDGSLAQSNHQWTGYSTCPNGYVPAAVRNMDLLGNIYDGYFDSIRHLFCDEAGCRAQAVRWGISIRAACVQHAQIRRGNQVESPPNQWSPWSNCPASFKAVGVGDTHLSRDHRDTLARWECTSNACRVWCDEGWCRIQANCASGMVAAVATCAASARDLKTVTTTGSSVACPPSGGYELQSCSCYSSGGGCPPPAKFSPSGGLCRRTSQMSGTVQITALCTKPSGTLRVTYGSSTIGQYTGLTAAWSSHTIQVTHPEVGGHGSARRALRFRENSGRDVQIMVKDVAITDHVSSAEKQGMFADPDNACTNTRWQVELPAKASGTPYTVEITYGDARAAVKTASCRIGISGHMSDASHPDGVIPKNQFKTVSKTVYVRAEGNDQKGILIFSGEAASACTGVNKIRILTEDRVRWASCQAGEEIIWELRPSRQSQGNFQLRSKARTSNACVNPGTGGMEACTPESDPPAHIKQLFSLDYLSVLAAKWTKFDAGRNEQAGACVHAVGKHLPHLAVSRDLVSCNAGQVLSSFLFRQDNGCKDASYYRFFYTCTNIVAIGASAACVTKHTRCVALTKQNAHLWELDKHDVGAECPLGMVLRNFQYKACGSERHSYQYVYTCCPAQGVGACSEHETEWGEVGEKSDLAALGHHKVECPVDSGLRRFLLEAQVPEVAAGEALQGEVRYIYTCCALPLAPPVSMVSRPAPPAVDWEGLYCPRGRVEGLPQFVGSSGGSLGFDPLSGSWCLKPKTGGPAMCALSEEGVTNPLDLPGGETDGVDYTPLLDFSTKYKGLGPSDVSREDMAQSLLSVGGGGAFGGGLKRKAFKKLPKIPQAKFEMAKFEQAEWVPFEGERAELQKRTTDEEILNWAPDAIQYAPHCLARNNRDMITGAEPYEGENTLTPEQRTKDVVGACYHTLGVDDSHGDAAATWGEEGTQGKVDTDWYFKETKVTRNGNGRLVSMGSESNPTFPGLTADAIWDCSTRDINRGLKIAQKERDYNIASNTFDMMTSWINGVTCKAIPGIVTVAGAIAAYAGTESDMGDICDAIANGIAGAANFFTFLDEEKWQKKYYDSDFQDCNPLQNSMQKVYCDLSCVEDAVKRGDAQILQSIGTLNNHILSEMNGFFDHYVTELFTRLTHMEDKSTYEAEALKKVMDTYAKGEIAAINSNGKQLTKTMNRQHSALNKNLGNAAKQIFDLTHGEHMKIADKLDAGLEATTSAIDDLKESTSQSFEEAFNTFTEEQLEAAGAANSGSLLELGKKYGAAVTALRRLGTAAENGDLDDDPRRAQIALQALATRLAATKNRVKGSSGATSGHQVLMTEATALGHAINESVASVLGAPKRHPLEGREDGAAVVGSETAAVLQAARAALGAQDASVDRLRRRIGELRARSASFTRVGRRHPWSRQRSSKFLAKDAKWVPETVRAHIDQQLVEFDKAMMTMRQSSERYIDAAEEQSQHVADASDLAEQYVSECSADFLELKVVVERARNSGRQAAWAARAAFRDVAQHLKLVADLLVDGELLEFCIDQAATSLNNGEDSNSVDNSAPGGVAAAALFKKAPGKTPNTVAELLSMTKLWNLVGHELSSRLRKLLPYQVVQQTSASFLLAEEMQIRHDSHGLGRLGTDDAVLMDQAWQGLLAELDSISADTYNWQTPLGNAFATYYDTALAQLARPPAECLAALEAAGRHESTWAVFNHERGDMKPILLMRGASKLAMRARDALDKGELAAVDLVSNAKDDVEVVECILDNHNDARLRQLSVGESRACLGIGSAALGNCTATVHVEATKSNFAKLLFVPDAVSPVRT